jgi:hypothetical protein
MVLSHDHVRGHPDAGLAAGGRRLAQYGATAFDADGADPAGAGR